MTRSPAPEAIKSIAFRGSDSRVEPSRTVVAPAQSDSRRRQADAPGALPSFSRKAGDADESVGAMFTVTYEDVTQGTGVGFDDPDVGAARRDTLHEVTHALCVLSVVDSDGASSLGNQGGFGLFTFFDSMLVRGSTGGCSVSGTRAGAIWPILLALLATKRRRMKRGEQPLG